METTVEGDCHDASDSKSSGSQLRRTRLSIDLNLPLPVIVNEGDCQHFSIRQYVAEMKKKNITICSPFESNSIPSQQLPYLEVPEQKGCRCANYTHKIGADGSTRDKTGLPYRGLRKENDQTSKEGDANLIEHNQCDLHKEIANDLKYRKTPKVRLMTDLLNEKVNLERSSMNAELFSVNNMSMELDTVVAPMDKGMRSSMENVITNSHLGDSEYDIGKCCLQNSRKSVKIKHTSIKNSGVSRRKHNQQAQVVDGCSLQIPLEGKNSGLGTNGFGANILIQPSHDSPSIEKVEYYLKNNNKSLHIKTDSDLSKLLEDTQASYYMNVVQDKNLQKGSLSKGEDVVKISMGTRMVTSQEENELYLKEKLGQTLSSFTGSQKYVKNDTIHRKNIPYWPLTILKGNKSCDPLKANGVESSQDLQKEVIPLVRQPIVVQSDQFRRNRFINLNRTIDLNHRQEIHISPNLLQRKNYQIQKLMETPRHINKMRLNEIQDYSYVTTPQRNQRPIKIIESGPSTYVSPMDNMEMFRNQHEMNHSWTQNEVLPWINPGSTNFNPFYANVEFLRGSTATMQVKEQPIKLSNSVQVSPPVPTRWELQNVKISNPVRFSTAQNTTFRSYNLNENHKRGQIALGSVQKGKTISDLKSTNSMRVEDKRTKGMRSLNPFSSEGMSATQLSRYQERPFTPDNIHPPFLMHGNPGIYNGLFLPHHQLKESSGVYMHDFTEVQSSRQYASYFKDQGVSLGSQEKKRKAHALEQLGGRKLQQSASSSGLVQTTRDLGPKVDLMQDNNISKTLDVGGYSIPATVFPVISIYKKNPPCLFNQNPADIADADDERYFRTVEDQRIRDKSSLRKKSRVDVKLDGR